MSQETELITEDDFAADLKDVMRQELPPRTRPDAVFTFEAWKDEVAFQADTLLGAYDPKSLSEDFSSEKIIDSVTDELWTSEDRTEDTQGQ